MLVMRSNPKKCTGVVNLFIMEETPMTIEQNNGSSEQLTADIILYKSEGANVAISVRFANETFWLSQKEIAELFSVTIPTINHHIKEIYQSEELEEEATIRKFLIVQKEGTRKVQREVFLYNLDLVISVGYRVNSLQATRFRQWATATLKEYITKGFVLNDDLLKNGAPFGKDYFDELLVRIRDIRASERRVYQKITDAFQECSFDYDVQSEIAQLFYATIQNKLHFAVTGQTAAEIITDRADGSKPFMGLTSWKGSPKGRIHSSDIAIAKNYLKGDEIDTLNRLVTMFLDDVELRVKDHVLMGMEDCEKALDGFLAYNRREILEGPGARSHKQAEDKARKEFEEYRKVQDAHYKNDFEKLAESLAKKDR